MKKYYKKFITGAATLGFLVSVTLPVFAWGHGSANAQCQANQAIVDFTFHNSSNQQEHVTASSPFGTKEFDINAGQDHFDSFQTNRVSIGSGTINFHIAWNGGSENTSAGFSGIECQQPTPTPTPQPTATPTPTETPTPSPTSTPTPTPQVITPTPTPNTTNNQQAGCGKDNPIVQSAGNTNNANVNCNNNQNQNNNTQSQSQTITSSGNSSSNSTSNSSNENNNSGNSTNNITVNPNINNNNTVTLTSWASPAQAQIQVLPVPQTKSLPSTGSPLTETLSLISMVPGGLLIKRFKKLG